MGMKKIGDWWLPESDVYFSKWVCGVKSETTYGHKFQLEYIEKIIELSDRHGVIIDAGANVGMFSYAFSKKFKIVYAFEPVPINFNCLQENLKTTSNVLIHTVALGSEAGIVKMSGRLVNTGSFHIVPDDTFSKKRNVIDVVEIPLVTLDSFNFDDVDVIKIDCEGFEFNVLSGAMNTLIKYKPLLAIEFTAVNKGGNIDTHNKVKNLLSSMGYKEMWQLADDAIYKII
jgi:FkbM family methyltransferase